MRGGRANGAAGGELEADALVGAPVRVRGLRVGTVVDLIADVSLERLLGAEVQTLADQRRFLPWAAADASASGVDVDSALVLLDVPELDWYADRGARLSGRDELRAGLVVRAGGRLAAARRLPRDGGG